MATLAYVLLPLTGMFAYLRGKAPRVRFHGLQAVLLGVAWPAALYGASYFSASATKAVFAVGTLGWMFLMVATAIGRDPQLPFVGKILRVWAEAPVG